MLTATQYQDCIASSRAVRLPCGCVLADVDRCCRSRIVCYNRCWCKLLVSKCAADLTFRPARLFGCLCQSVGAFRYGYVGQVRKALYQ